MGVSKNVLIIAVIVAFVVGVIAGVFLAPTVLFHGHRPGSFAGRGNHNSTKTYAHYNYSVNIATLPGIGQYLVNSSGWALYMYVPDTPNSGKSTCYGECVIAWPVFYASNLTVEPGINASLFGNITRTGGSKETTFNGYPLYYYEYDTGAGNINGQGVGGIWYLMSPSGAIIKNSST